jgi:sulfonate transport system substrate-binding protein
LYKIKTESEGLIMIDKKVNNIRDKKTIYSIAGIFAVVLIIVAVVIFFKTSSSADSTSKETKKPVVRFGSSAGESGNLLGISAVAWEEGYIQEELDKIGYDVEVLGFANGVAVNEAFVSDEIDVSTLGDVPAAVGFSNNIGTRWLAVGLSTYNNTIVAAADSEIDSVEDLAGKSVAFSIGTTTQYLWESVVKEFGLDSKSIESVNLGGANAINALTAGEVDAIVLGENQAKVLEAEGTGKIILSTAEYTQWAPSDTFVGREEYLKENPEVAVAILKGFIRARETVIANPEKYYVTLSALQLQDHPNLGDSIYNVDNGEFKNLDAKIYDDNIKREQALADFLLSVDKISNKVDISKYVDSSYYEKALAELSADKNK